MMLTTVRDAVMTAVLSLCLSQGAFADANSTQDTHLPSDPVDCTVTSCSDPIWQPCLIQFVLYNNGSVVNSPGIGTGDADESVVHDHSLRMVDLGATLRVAADLRLADATSVTAARPWTIYTFTVFVCQIHPPSASTITSARLRIRDGLSHEPAGTAAFSDTSTNRMNSSSFSTFCCVSEFPPGETAPRFQAIVIDPGRLQLMLIWPAWYWQPTGRP